ncbi:hypothetical protein KIN20_033627 [Parelaphostrongylus tenuis]|uniref:Uncharacterized protein n=1 Tax=Parelaphostrongylus tenuis TaxID=148309 RepID=A0AAD5R8N7_PARTN|nr:hypothetical protein KIN20_033627 [Parelaphostrongylus tenuis]
MRNGDTDLIPDQHLEVRVKLTEKQSLKRLKKNRLWQPMIFNVQTSRSGRFWKMQTRNGARAISIPHDLTIQAQKNKKKQIVRAHLCRNRRSSFSSTELSPWMRSESSSKASVVQISGCH